MYPSKVVGQRSILVLREGLTLVAAGLALGLIGALAMQRAVSGEIYGVQPLDPTVLAVVIVTLATISLIACALPRSPRPPSGPGHRPHRIVSTAAPVARHRC